LEAQALVALAEEGYGADEVRLQFSIDLRFRGQDTELSPALDGRLEAGASDRLRQAFLADYKAIYQYASDDQVEVVNLRLVARGVRRNKIDFGALDVHYQSKREAPARRQVYFSRAEGWLEAPVLTGAALSEPLPEPLRGPALVETPDATIAVPPDGRLAVDGSGNVRIDLP